MKGMKGVLLAVAVLGLAACGDEPEVTLTETEAKSLFVSFLKTPQGDTVSESPGKAVLSCPAGGTVTVTGTFALDEKGDTMITRLKQTLAPEGCETNGFVLNGDPAVNYDTEVTTVGFFESVTMVGAVKGSLKWQKGDDEGTCDIDMTLAAETEVKPDNPTIEGAFTGKLCGHEMKIDAAEVISIDVDE
ncbi:MAG: hypothetical protein OXU64_06735 [Gemmatimonadota bacterium]|nr:hypothetical protein [Gemmatimonadota bacterium]